MTAFNVGRFRVRPGMEEAFVDAHRTLRPAFKGFLGWQPRQDGVTHVLLHRRMAGLSSIVAAPHRKWSSSWTAMRKCSTTW